MRICLIAFITLFSIPFGLIRAQNTCHAADNNSAHFIFVLNKLMAAEQSNFRGGLQLPLVPTSGITLVSDSTICARAGAAADSMMAVWASAGTYPPTTAPIYVVSIGTSYAVADLNSAPDDERDWVFIFGPLWEYRGSISM